MKDDLRRKLYLVGGCLSVGLGVLGIFLPIFPTVPFLLLASCCFSRSSEKLHSWLNHHPSFGESIRSWEQEGVISRRAKWMATLGIILGGGTSLTLVAIHNGVKLLAAATLFLALCFIWSRPSESRKTEE